VNLSKKNVTIIVSAAIVSLFLVSIAILTLSGFLSLWKDKPQILSCAQFSNETRAITVTCDFTLSEVHDAISDDSALKKESADGVWFLNSSIIISKGAVLTINPTEARWLKISSESFGKIEPTPYIIDVYGGFDIQGIRITSWNPLTNNYTYQRPEGTVPRPSIIVQEGADPSHIEDSEIAYLGYNSSRKHGISFYGGDRSVLSGNKIHDLWYGFFSTNVGHMIIENNDVYRNLRYGIDPHEGSHDFIIKGNYIYKSRIGLICSLQCSNMVFENNRIENNNEAGIMFSRDTVNSTARYNNITLSDTGISVSDSHSNRIYHNALLSNDYGVAIKNNSSENLLFDNIIYDPTECGILVGLGRNNTISENRVENYKESGICLTKGNQNTFHSNIIDGLGKYAIDVRHGGIGNSFSGNAINLASNAIRVYNNTGTLFINNKVGNTDGHQYLISGNSTLNLINTRFLGDRIRAAGMDINTVKIWNSGVLEILTNHAGNASDVSIYETDVKPYVAKLSYVTINLYSKSGS
jgi:poly(beta-D-mannuronate) C5 epimerase